jgi:uncharacterized protein YdeI (YjbR/CyaY-like superfamily)
LRVELRFAGARPVFYHDASPFHRSGDRHGMDPKTANVDPRVDAYIAKAAPFARPILAHLRHTVHAACPDVEETLKWSMPFFVYRGSNLCHMAAFKAHCAFGFWRGKEIPGLDPQGEANAMGNLGRVLSLDDLPPKRRLTGFIKTAMKLAESGAKPVRTAATKRAALEMPADFAAALAAHPAASRGYEAFAPSAQLDYLEWILEAKRDATRAARIATAVEWIAEGKTRNWKYVR